MSCARLDDQLPQSAKWGSLSSDAFRLGIVALCWAREDRNLRKRPGFIPAAMLVGMARRPARAAAALARELVNAGKPLHDEGIWVDVDGGWMIHDFADYGDVDTSDGPTTVAPPTAPSGPSPRSEAARIGGLASAEARRSKNGTAQPERPVRTTCERNGVGSPNDSRTAPNDPPERTPNVVERRSNKSFENHPNVGGSSSQDPSQDPKISDLRVSKETAEDLKTCQDLARGGTPNESRTASNASPDSVVLNSLTEALKYHVVARSRAAQDKPSMADWAQAECWPEVIAVAQTLAEATGKPVFTKLGPYSRDFGVQAIVALLAAEISVADIQRAVAFTVRSEWWTKPGASRGLSSFSLEVTKRALAAADGNPRPARTVRKVDERSLEEQGFVPPPDDFLAATGLPPGTSGPEAVAAILTGASK